MSNSINKIEIPNFRIDNYKFSSFVNFLFDDTFISKIIDKKGNDYFNHLSSYQESVKVLEKESVEIPILIEGFGDHDKILDLVSKTLTKYKIIPFIKSEKSGYFIKITNINSEKPYQFNFVSDPEKGAYLDISLDEINVEEMLEDLQVEFNNDLYNVIKYFHFLRLQKQVKLSLQTDLTKLLIAKKSLTHKIADYKEDEIKLANKLRRIINELNAIVSEQFGKYKSGILGKRMRLQSKGIQEFGIKNEYKIQYYAEDNFLIIKNGNEISEKISNDLIIGFIKDSDARIAQLNQSANKLINQLSQEVKISDSSRIPKDKFLNLSEAISTEPLLDKLNFYFNFDEIEIDKRTNWNWPDVKSLLMSIIFTSVFYISSFPITTTTNAATTTTDKTFWQEWDYLWAEKPGILILRVSFLILSLSTFILSLYTTNKKLIKVFFKSGLPGIRELKKDLRNKQIDSLLTRQMSDYGSDTNDSINNFLDLMSLKYKKIKEQMIEDLESDFGLILSHNNSLRTLAENDLAELNVLIQTIQSKLN